jgi:hypothetical protein
MPLDLQKTFSTNNTLTKNAFTCFYLSNILEPSKFDVVTIEGVLEDIKSEKYKSLIDALPDSLVDENAYKLAKKKLPAWALNGVFKDKIANDCFIKSTSEFHFEIDKLDKKQVAAIKKAIAKQCPYIYALWRSPSQRGLKGLIRIADDLIHSDADFKQAFIQIEKALAALGFVIDASCKDVRRLCFVCSDKDIYINEDAETFKFNMSLWGQTNLLFKDKTQGINYRALDGTTKALMNSPTPETPREIAKLRSMLGYISSDCSYRVYRDVVWAILSLEWTCSEQLALDWSMTTPTRYQEVAFYQLINSYDKWHLNSPSMGTIYHLARAGGWDG